MKKRIIIIVFIIFIFGLQSNVLAKTTIDPITNNLTAKQMLKGKKYVKNELIVVFKNKISNTNINSIIKKEKASLKKIISLDSRTKAASISISENDSMEELITKFQNNPQVEMVQPNYIYSFQENNSIKATSDYYYQYYLDIIKASEAITIVEKTSHPITKISVIDSGVDIYHEDLQSNLNSNTGYTAILNGKKSTRTYDPKSHGTHVIGIIGATSGNGIGIKGVASGNKNNLVKIIPIGISNDKGNMISVDVIEAINYSVSQNVKVISMSIMATAEDPALETAVKNAYNNGIVLVACSGNEGSKAYVTPSDYKEVISVNASNSSNKATSWSNYGIYKDITAPGEAIISTIPNSKYITSSGTSMATPIVTAVAALVLDVNPKLTPAQVYNILCATTSSTIFDNALAYGIINAKAAVTAAKSASSSVPVTSLTVKTKSQVINKNNSYALESLIRPATSLKKASWSSNDTSIATVNSNGKITGISKGDTTIVGKVDGKTATCKVTVLNGTPTIEVLIKNKSNFQKITQRETKGLVAIVYNASIATTNKVVWSTSNQNIISVNADGVITAKAVGQAKITAKTSDGKYSDSILIEVKEPASQIVLTSYKTKMLKTNTTIFSGKALTANGQPLDYNGDIIWTSSKPLVAKINSTTGRVEALNPGITYITATVKYTREFINPITRTIRLAVGKQNYSGSDYGLKITSRTYNSISLKWNSISVASSYIILRAVEKNGTYYSYKKVTTNTYKDTGLKFNKTYYYKVKAKYSDSIIFSNSYKVYTRTALSRPVLSVKKTTENALRLSWTKISGANGYILYRYNSTKKAYLPLKRITSGSIITYKDINLKHNKRYYYKIKAYRYSNGVRVYSSISLKQSAVVS